VVVCGALVPNIDSLSQAIEKFKKAEQDHELQQYLMNFVCLGFKKVKRIVKQHLKNWQALL
jgi:hypothetical protein